MPRFLRSRSALLIGASLGFFAASLFGSSANAVVIRNVTAGTTVFADDFESGTFAASVGTSSGGPDVTVINSTTPPNPGPATGAFYVKLFRDSNTFGQGNFFASTSSPQATSGDLIRMSWMMYFPDATPASRATLLLDDVNFNNARAGVTVDGAGNVMAMTGAGFTLVDTGLDYATGAWQRWDLEYVIGASTFAVSVNGASASGFPSHSVGQVTLGEIFNGTVTPGSFFIDAVPEPAGAALLFGAGVLLRRSLRARRVAR